MRTPLLSSAALMDASESRIDVLRHCASAEKRQVVERLVETPSTYSRWLSFHFGIMQKVAAGDSAGEQRLRLRKASFSLVHRQALFQHLRDARISGQARRAVFRAFHGDGNYARAVVAEHGLYLESNSSLYCAQHLDLSLLNDGQFAAQLDAYRDAYLEFFGLYCNWVIAEDKGQFYPFRPMFPDMKKQLLAMQSQLLALPVAAERRRQPRVPRSLWG